MKILMLCTKFSIVPNDGWLTNELAVALQSCGHNIQVIVIGWTDDAKGTSVTTKIVDDVDVMLVSAKPIRLFGMFIYKVTKWAPASFVARRHIKTLLGNQSFDLVLCFSPAWTVYALIRWAKRRFDCRSYFVLWDFFPFHHRSIGVITSPLMFQIGRILEQWTIRSFDVVGCMSPRNIEYLKTHYRLRPEQRVTHLPIWGDTSYPADRPMQVVRTAFDLPLRSKIAIFGGQLEKGRGIEYILAAASLARVRRPDIMFLLIGEGSFETLVLKTIAAGDDNVMYRRRIPREDYLTVAAACDVALVCTVPGVDVPTFPSKTIDYLRAGLPIIAAVEDTTDYADFVVEHGFGAKVPLGDPAALVSAIERIVDHPEEAQKMSASGRQCLHTTFSVSNVAQLLVNQAVSLSTG